MLKLGTEELLRTYCAKHPEIAEIEAPLRACIERLVDCFSKGGQLLICGNGGSCADADHIVGELVKAFRLKRPLTAPLAEAMREHGLQGELLADHLQEGLPAINLGAHASLLTAMMNDVGGKYMYAQQVVAYGRVGDILLGICTSWNSEDVLCAGLAAKAKGLWTLGLTGRTGGRMESVFDLVLHGAADTTEGVQDVHSVIYHTICACIEYQCWGEG